MKIFKRIVLVVLSIAIIIIFLIISYFAINFIFNPWETNLTLEFQQNPESICFYNETGFMSVQKSPVDALVNNNIPTWKAWNSAKSLILQTNNYGNTWEKIYNGTGSIPCLSYDNKNGSLYALIRLYKESEGFSSKVIRTKNSGKIWETYLSSENYIKGINFSNPFMPFMWSTNSILFVKDGKIIKTVKLQTEDYINKPVVDDNNNIWVSYNDTVAKIVQNGSVSIGKINHDIRVDAMSWNFSTGELFLVGRSGNSDITRLLKQDEIGKYTEIKEFRSLIADALLIQDKSILLLGTSTKKGGFFGMGTLLFLSRDNGENWKKDRNYPVFAREPLFFNSDSSLWIYGAMERVKRRTI